MTYRELLNILLEMKESNPEMLKQSVRLELEENEVYDIETIYENDSLDLYLTIELTNEVNERIRQN